MQLSFHNPAVTGFLKPCSHCLLLPAPKQGQKPRAQLGAGGTLQNLAAPFGAEREQHPPHWAKSPQQCRNLLSSSLFSQGKREPFNYCNYSHTGQRWSAPAAAPRGSAMEHCPQTCELTQQGLGTTGAFICFNSSRSRDRGLQRFKKSFVY